MKLPKLMIPILVVAMLFGGYFLRTAFTQPTTSFVYSGTPAAQSTFIVDGLKCKGTATFFSSLYDSIPGIAGIVTYAADHKAIISYDPDMVSADSIKSVMEAEIEFDDGTRMQIFECISVD